MSSWNCDGVPKNGREYPDFGGAHDLYKNHSTNCDLCGLPKEAMDSESAINSSVILLFLKSRGEILILGIAILLGVFFVYLNRDSEGEDYFLVYEEAVEAEKQALLLIRNHKTPEQLIAAQGYLNQSVTKLGKIPSESSIYSDVETKINTSEELLF